MDKEFWRAVPGYTGYYAISNFGRIKNVQTGRIITPQKNTHRQGREKFDLRVDLYKGKKRKHFPLARLMLQTFVGEPQPNDVAIHIDGDILNNRLDNLAYASIATAQIIAKEGNIL